MKKTPGQQARDALFALEQEKAVYSGMARRGALDAYKRIEDLSKDPKIRDKDLGRFLAANIWICEQAYGKPSQRQEHTGADGGPLSIKVLVYDTKDGEPNE